MGKIISHYSVVKTRITKKSCLIKALQKLGFEKHMLEYSDSKMTLKGYQGDNRSQKANLRIRGSGWGHTQNYVGGASNDLGWELMEDGSYAFHVSEYDKGMYNANWQKKLMNEYSRAVVHEYADEGGFFVVEEETEADGSIHIRLESHF